MESSTAVKPREFNILERYEVPAYVVALNDVESIYIGNGCNGLMITALYIGFILAYPGRWKPKLGFIVFGTIALYVLNIIRILLLAVHYEQSRTLFEINHKYTYVFLVYSVVFLLWIKWVNNYSVTANLSNGRQ